MNIKIYTLVIHIFLLEIININSKTQRNLISEDNNKENELDSNNGEYDLRKLVKFNCTDSAVDCSGNGVCSENGLKCDCYKGYQTFYENYEDYLTNKPRCNYKSKQQINALLFSLFLSFGSAHFYLGHSLIGIIQLLFFSFVFIFNVTFIIKLSIKHIKKMDRAQVKTSFNLIIIMIILSVLFLFWYLFDLIMIYLNIYRDSKNAKMFSYLK